MCHVYLRNGSALVMCQQVSPVVCMTVDALTSCVQILSKQWNIAGVLLGVL